MSETGRLWRLAPGLVLGSLACGEVTRAMPPPSDMPPETKCATSAPLALDIFKRSEGWKIGDGAYSIALPPVRGESGGRLLWLFGDTLLWHGEDGPVVQPADATHTGGLDPSALRLLVGNTAAVSRWTERPGQPSETRFYAREKVGDAECGTDATQWATHCPVRDITDAVGMPDDFERLQGAGGFLPKDRHDREGWRYNWPKDAVYVATPVYPPGYSPPAPFDPDSPESFLAMGFIRFGGVLVGESQGYAIITGVDGGGPEQWTYRGVSAEPADSSGWGLLFGNALLHRPEHNDLRIYGEVRRAPEGFDAFLKDMVLAVASPPTDIADPSRWSYYYADTASATPCADVGLPREGCFRKLVPTTSELKASLGRVARDIVGDFAVDRVCHLECGDGRTAPVDGCAYILSHGAYYEVGGMGPIAPGCPAGEEATVAPGLMNPRWIALRSTEDDTVWPPLTRGSFGTKEGVGGRQSTVLLDRLPTAEWDQKLMCGAINSAREVRQIRAHDDILDGGRLVVSWYLAADCSWGADWCGYSPPRLTENVWPYDLPAPQRTEGTRLSNVRFGAVPLSALAPWCSARDTCP